MKFLQNVARLIRIAKIGSEAKTPTSYNVNKEINMARIVPVNYDGTPQFQLVNNGEVLAGYSRARDARRGAARRGLSVA